jgi:hypothetical protein
MPPERPNQFKMLLSDEELNMLRKLSEDKGLSASDYLRQTIRRIHEEGEREYNEKIGSRLNVKKTKR